MAYNNWNNNSTNFGQLVVEPPTGYYQENPFPGPDPQSSGTNSSGFWAIPGEAQVASAQPAFAQNAPTAAKRQESSSSNPSTETYGPSSGSTSPDAAEKHQSCADGLSCADRRRQQNLAAAARSRERKKAQAEATAKELEELRAKAEYVKQDMDFIRNCLAMQGMQCCCQFATCCRAYFSKRAQESVEEVLGQPVPLPDQRN